MPYYLIREISEDNKPKQMIAIKALDKFDLAQQASRKGIYKYQILAAGEKTAGKKMKGAFIALLVACSIICFSLGLLLGYRNISIIELNHKEAITKAEEQIEALKASLRSAEDKLATSQKESENLRNANILLRTELEEANTQREIALQLIRQIQERYQEVKNATINLYLACLQIYEELKPIEESGQSWRFHRLCMDRIVALDKSNADKDFVKCLTKIAEIHAKWAKLHEEYLLAKAQIQQELNAAIQFGAALGAGAASNPYERNQGAFAGALLFGIIGAAASEEKTKKLDANYQQLNNQLLDEWKSAWEELNQHVARVSS